MTTDTFSTQYHSLTPTGEINFIGAVLRYFDSYTADCLDATKDTYISDYNCRIFPVINPGVPIKDYDEACINELLQVIQKTNSYNDSTLLSRYRHLLADPIEAYFKEVARTDNPLWGAAYKMNQLAKDGSVAAALLRTPKSLSLSQEICAADLLLDPLTDNGSRVGLATMLCCGVRNNEAAGLNFGDFTEMMDHPGYYMLTITRTSIRNRNERKAGGKTKNAPRRIPLFARFSEFLLERKNYLG